MNQAQPSTDHWDWVLLVLGVGGMGLSMLGALGMALVAIMMLLERHGVGLLSSEQLLAETLTASQLRMINISQVVEMLYHSVQAQTAQTMKLFRLAFFVRFFSRNWQIEYFSRHILVSRRKLYYDEGWPFDGFDY